MRHVRQILTLFILSCYLFMAVGGQALHLLQCTSCDTGENCSPTDHSHDHCAFHDHTHDHCGVHDHAHDTPRDRTDDPSVPVRDHDSSNCAVCQILGQVQETVAEFKVDSCTLAISFVPAIGPAFYPIEQRAAFQGRAPPLA